MTFKSCSMLSITNVVYCKKICESWLRKINYLCRLYNFFSEQFLLLMIMIREKIFPIKFLLTASRQLRLPRSVLSTHASFRPDQRMTLGRTAVDDLIAWFVVGGGRCRREHEPFSLHHQPSVSWSAGPSTFWMKIFQSKVNLFKLKFGFSIISEGKAHKVCTLLKKVC